MHICGALRLALLTMGLLTTGSSEDACVARAESWCSAESSCRAFGVHNDEIQLHSCNVTMPNLDWKVYVRSDSDSYTLLPGHVDINASACSHHKLSGRTDGRCTAPPPSPPTPKPCSWAPGATPCGPSPPRPYEVLGSVSTGVLEASIFLWQGTEMML
eukprot:COSAG06_NODE_58_length_27483_cov_37.992989_21_plen_158_part_00